MDEDKRRKGKERRGEERRGEERRGEERSGPNTEPCGTPMSDQKSIMLYVSV